MRSLVAVLGIAVWLLLLSAGCKATIEQELVEPSAISVSKNEVGEGADEEGVLKFDHVPLSKVVKVLNDYNETQIELADPAIGEKKISAKLRLSNLDGFLRLVEVALGLRSERIGSSAIVLRRNDER